MPSSRHRALASVFVDDPDPDRVLRHRDALQAELLDRLPARDETPRWGRRMLIGGLASAAAVAACQLPADYDLRVGHRITINLDADQRDAVPPQAVIELLRDEFAAESIGVRAKVERHQDGDTLPVESMQLSLEVAGANADVDTLVEGLTSAFPVLRGAEIDIETMRERVEGTLGGKLSDGWLDEIIDRHGVEEAKRRIRQRLEADGLPDGAQVDVRIEDEPGRREVRVEVRHAEDEP